MDGTNSNTESLFPEEVSNRQDNLYLTSNIYKSKSFPDLRREFLIKSFIFLFAFNLIISIPLSVLVLCKKNFFNEIAIFIFVGLLIALSIIAEIGGLGMTKYDILYNIITIVFGLSLMGLSFFFPYPIYLLFFFVILLANNVLFILISLTPYKYNTRILMYISNALIIILALILPILPIHINMTDNEFYVALISFFSSFFFVTGHTTSAYDKAEEIEDEKYNYYKSQVYVMKGTVISSAHIIFYTLNYLFIIMMFLIKNAAKFIFSVLDCLCKTLTESSKSGEIRESESPKNYIGDANGAVYCIQGNKITRVF